MFEHLRILESPERSIVVQTHVGRNIENVVAEPGGERALRKFEVLKKRFGMFWEMRKDATGTYNCAGHVWASRRTAILNPEDWKTILKDDGYRPVESDEFPATGDLVIYSDETGYVHVGEVHLRMGLTHNSPAVPWVLSKLDSVLPEVLHHVEHPAIEPPFTRQFWTDRPSRKAT